jgi:hypothetical protein
MRETDILRLLGVLKLRSHTGVVFPILVWPCVFWANGASWKGLAPFLSLQLAGSDFQLPSVPSNKCSNF